MNGYFEWLHLASKTCWNLRILFPRREKRISVKYVFWKIFKISIKLIAVLFLLYYRPFLLKEHWKGNWTLKEHSKDTPKTLQGYSKGTWALRHSKDTWALGHSRQLDTLALEHLRHSGTRRQLGHSGTQCTWALVHAGTGALPHSGSQALKHSGHRGTFISRPLKIVGEEIKKSYQTRKHYNNFKSESITCKDRNYGKVYGTKAALDKFQKKYSRHTFLRTSINNWKWKITTGDKLQNKKVIANILLLDFGLFVLYENEFTIIF